MDSPAWCLSHTQLRRLRQPHRPHRGQIRDLPPERLGLHDEVQDYLVRPINFVINIVGCVLLRFANDVKHFRDRKLMFRKESLSEIVTDTITVLTLVALRNLSDCHLLDCVRTLAVRTRHPVRPPVITQGTPNRPLCQAETPRWGSLLTIL